MRRRPDNSDKLYRRVTSQSNRLSPETPKDIFGDNPGFCGLNVALWFATNALMFLFAVYVCVMLVDSNYKWQRLSGQQTEFDRLKSQISLYQGLDEKGQANGYAPLDETTTIPAGFFDFVFEDAAKFMGCWDANNNIPTLISSSGDGSMQFLTCVPGSTFLNGVTQWFLYDVPSFIPDLGAWIKFEGTVNQMTSQEPVDVDEIEIFSDGTGPTFSIKTLRPGEAVNISKIDNSTIIVDAEDTFSVPTSISDTTPVPASSESIVNDGVGPDLKLNTIAYGTDRPVEDNDTLVVNAPGFGRASGETTNFAVAISSNINSLFDRDIFFTRVRNVIYLSQDFLVLPDFSPYTNAMISFDLSTSPEIQINRFNTIDQATGYVTGYAIEPETGVNDQNNAGFCYRASSTTVICRFSGTKFVTPPDVSVVKINVFIVVSVS